MIFENDGASGFGFEHFATRTATGTTPQQVLVAQIFGVFPIYAFFYWRNVVTRGIAKDATVYVDSADRDSRQSGVAVSIQGLEKTFGSVRAVDGLTVDFMQDEITAFLGHNGAGKSTTISILTGAIRTTRGDAFINGHSIVKDMRRVRPMLGVCAQANVLWDLLSVEEHVCLFASIRGQLLQPGDHEVTELLTAVGLLAKKDVKSKQLSGGMKRKLCFACALVGDPKVIFLDEPTAGMDAQARRDVWKLLIRKRSGRCIVLCTHYMDEADILGDRIAVVHDGKLQACGTPTELKTKYGRGTHLTVTVTEKANRRELLPMLEAAGAREAKFDVSCAGDTTDAMNDILERRAVEDLHLLLDAASDLPQVFAELSRAKQSAATTGVSDFGLIATTMDDVFWELDQEASRTGEPANANHTISSQVWDSILRSTTVPPAHTKLMSILGRRTTTFVRDWGQMGMQLLNIAFLVLGAMVASTDLIRLFPSPSLSTREDLSPAVFESVPRMGLAYQTTNGSSTGEDALIPQMKTWAAADPVVPLLVDGAGMPPCIDSWLISITDPTTCGRNLTIDDPLGEPVVYAQTPGGFAGVIEFTTFPPNRTTITTDYAYIVSPNSSVLFSLPVIVSLTNNAIRAVTNGTTSSSSILASYQSLPPTPKSPEELLVEKMIQAQIGSAIGGMVIVLALNFLMAYFAESVAEDKHKCVKQLQVLMGVTVTEYWVTQFLWDYTLYCVIMVIPVVYIFASQGYLAHIAVVTLLALFPWAMLPFTYLIARLFNRGHTVKALISGVGMIVFMLTFMLYFALAILKVNPDVLSVLRILFCVYPPTALALGLRAVLLSDAYGYSPYTISPPNPDFDLGFPVESAFVPLLGLVANALLFSVLLMRLESTVARKAGPCTHCYRQVVNMFCRCACCACCYMDKKTKKPYPKPARLAQDDVEDADVRAERAACDAEIARTNGKPSAPVHFHHVRKQYAPNSRSQRWLSDGLVACNDMCLRLRDRECFALLGSNGAGKTTVLSILMRQLSTSEGECYVHGQLEAIGAVQRGFGYCPQENALFDTLTTVETLQFYATVRGVPLAEVTEYAQCWLDATQLTSFAHTRCGKLSGGNKRKLSLAIAVMGNPSLVVLDEPSAGVDPAARKKLHHSINAVRRGGATVVLTTHHMSEAAALGSRIGIMLHGHLACLGTPQHLLMQYSIGYELSVCMVRGNTVDEEVLPLLQQKCPNHEMIENPDENYCKVALGPANSFSLPELYAALEVLKGSNIVEHFSCGQANLESVFLRFTAKAEAKEREAEEQQSYTLDSAAMT